MMLSRSVTQELSKTELISKLTCALQRSACSEAEILALLSEVDARRLYAERGFSSMFEYCTRSLHLSESTAYARIGVARATRKFPVLLDQIRNQNIHLAGLRLLVPHLTRENQDELLEQVKHKTRDEIARLLADRVPKPDAAALIRRVPSRRLGGTSARTEASVPFSLRPAPKPEPLGQDRFKVQFTADAELHEKLREAQALLRHQVPDGNPAKVIDKALTLLIEHTKRKKFGKTSRSKCSKPNAKPSRHVPAKIRRTVSARDAGSCCYVSPDGHRCASRDFLEFDHQKPWSRFHRHRPEEIRLLCRTHNQYFAELEYGRKHMNRFREDSQLDPDPVGS